MKQLLVSLLQWLAEKFLHVLWFPKFPVSFYERLGIKEAQKWVDEKLSDQAEANKPHGVITVSPPPDPNMTDAERERQEELRIP